MSAPRRIRHPLSGARAALAAIAAVLLIPLVQVPASAAQTGAPAERAALVAASSDAADEPAAGPLPGQSDQPAPASRTKRVIENVHTDTVSAYLDDGRLVLESKADVDGVIGKRFVTAELLFHLSDAGLITVPDLPAFSFLGPVGARVWLAPQIQDHAIIWPGFSTEDPNLRGKVQGDVLNVRLLGAVGPGDVEVYLQDAGTPRRIFSSTTALPDWQTGVPQHTHMNWAFTQPGTYVLTFEMEGVVDGRGQSARNDYTFVVGDLAAHTQRTATTLVADTQSTVAGDPVTLTATVAPEAVGAVQFRDTTSGTLLGHTPLSDGRAGFRTATLPPGTHEIVAEFVPTWDNDFTASASPPVTVTVAGDHVPRPEADDTEPVTDHELGTMPAGAGTTVTNAGKTVQAGQTAAARVRDDALHGQWVSVWLHAAAPTWLGWWQVDLAGAFSVGIPGSTAAGDHRLVVKDSQGSLVGWDRLRVVQPAADPGDGGGGGGGAPQPEPELPVPEPVAPPQQCQPGIVLDHGHIDAFYVSAANGQAVLQLMEDVTGHRVVREAETVLLRVKESAWDGSIRPGVPGGPAGYVLPLSQRADLIWPGWDTNRTTASGMTDVSIHVTHVDGPGTVYLYTQGSFGDWQPILTHGGYAFPGTIREATPAHTHAQWVFSQKGIYRFTAHAVATDPRTGESARTATRTYVFQVGDVPLGDAFCTLRPTATDVAAAVDAAVREAALQAIAASQAEAVPEAEAEADQGGDARARRSRDPGQEAGGVLDAIFGEDANPVLVAAVVGGGVLALTGIVGGTVWWVRRIGAGAGGRGGQRAG